MTKIGHKVLVLILLPSVFAVSVNCAGPSTPFGAVEFGSGDGFAVDATAIPAEPSAVLDLQAWPKRQNLHRPAPLKIQIGANKVLPPETKLVVTYNKKNVTKAFRKFAQEEKHANQQVTYIYDHLKLRPDRKHQIDIYAVVNDVNWAHFQLLPPECPMELKRRIASTEPFVPPLQFLNSIDRVAKENQLSPTFLAGLIAQESGFDPQSVSSAKAVGLTQVTPLADEEIRRLRPHWRRDSRIQELNSSEIEDLIADRKLSKKNDWRLNPDLAVEGGALYLSYLRDYWSSNENRLLLKSYPDIRYEDVILASYNSGAARVKIRIQKRGQRWLEDEELQEARKYVNRIRSYCYHFSEEAQ